MRSIIIFAILLVLASCANTNYLSQENVEGAMHKVLEDATALTSGGLDDEEGTGVGCAGFHINGKDAQAKLALSRAIDEVASQVSTTVSSERQSKKSYKNGRALGSSTKQKSMQTSNATVRTKIIRRFEKDGKICYIVKKL